MLSNGAHARNENAAQEWALRAGQNSHLWIIREEVVAFPRPSSCLHERGISRWKLAACSVGFALKGPVREQMAQRTGKDYQRGKGSSSVVKSFVNS